MEKKPVLSKKRRVEALRVGRDVLKGFARSGAVDTQPLIREGRDPLEDYRGEVSADGA